MVKVKNFSVRTGGGGGGGGDCPKRIRGGGGGQKSANLSERTLNAPKREI